MIPAARIRQRDTVYRIQHPDTGLCVRLVAVPVEGSADLRIVPRLEEPKRASWFANYEQACIAFARYIGPAPLEIVRSDA